MTAVSIIMPIYNGEEHLRESLDSVLRQSLRDIEILCVDDGSTDATASILQEYRKIDARVKVIHQENAGAASARNRAMEVATGKYLAFLDADDTYAPRMLERLYALSEQKKLDVAMCAFDTQNVMTGEQRRADWALQEDLLPVQRPFRATDVAKNFFGAIMWYPWNKLFRRSFVTKYDLRFQEITSTNDLLFVENAMLLAERMDTCSEALVVYRIGNASSLQGRRSKDGKCFLQAFRALRRFLHEQHLFDRFRVDFANIFLQASLNYLGTVDEQQHEKFLQALRDTAWEEMGVAMLAPEEFYEQRLRNRWERLREMKDAIAVSVIVPVYNVERYLRQCLDSIVCQTLGNIEIICIDDLSTDASMEILQEYAQKDHRFVILQNDINRGAAYSRNTGIKIARGKYLSVVDSDDFFAPDYLEQLYVKCERFSADVAVCRFENFNDQTHLVQDLEWVKPSEEQAERFQYVFSLSEQPDFLMIVGHPPFTKMCRRDFIIGNGIFFQELPNCNDVFFNLIALASAERIVHVNQPLIYYRIARRGSISSLRERHPLAVYMSIREVFRRMRRESSWPILKRHFYTQFVISINYEFSCSSEKTRQRMKWFWRKRGLKNIGMDSCEPDDFYKMKYFVRWQKIRWAE